MKKLFMILPLALILCFVVGCQDKEAMAELEAMKAQAEVEEQNIALVKRHYEAWNSGDVEALREIFSPDYLYNTPAGKDESLEQMIELLKPQMEAFPDRIFSVEDMLAKGDKVVSRFIGRGTHEGEFMGIPATGNKFEITGIEIWRVENGKIVESWDAHDSLSLFQQLGMELKPKEGKK
jgi:steroid delta-isomerase-like uncharacterized protein